MTRRATGRDRRAEADQLAPRRRGSPARGILIGLLIAAPCWLAIAYGVHLLLSRL